MNRPSRRRLAGGLAIAVAAAFGLRLFFVLTPHAVLDADEAIVGLMGRHVLRGEFPVFYYGQRYMGGLESYLAALGFALGGATPRVLKLVCLAVALVLVWLTAELARRILGPGPGVVAGLFTALPPIFLTVWSLKARGGYIETLVLGALVLLLAHRTAEATGRRRPRTALVLGLVAGLGWWTSQLIVSYLVAAGLLVIRGAGWVTGLRVLPLVTGAFALGSLPMWLPGWLGQPGAKSMWAVVDPGTGARQLASVFTIGLPALLGPGGQWPTAPVLEALTPALLGVYGLVWIGLLAARVRTWRGGSDPSPAGGAALDALLALPVVAAAACALSPVGWFLSEPRYLLPLGAIVPILIAASLTTLWRAGQRGLATVLGTAVVAVNLAGHVLAPWTSAREAPRSLEATVAFFEARRIPVVATTYWIGSRLAFESAERVVAVPIRDGVDRYPPYVALARRTDRLAYAFFEGTADVGATEERLETLGVARHRTSLGELVILHDLRLPGLEPAPPGLFFETLERLPLLEARLRIAAAYETAGLTDRAIRYLEAILEPGMPAGSAGVDRLVSLYRATGEPAKASALAARRAAVYTPAEPREADFGGAVRLLGYTLGHRSVRAGERVELVCFWSTRRRLEADLYLGVQVTGAMRRHLGSFGPVTGGYSATSWQPDEAVPGALDVAIPRDFPPGRYALRIRLWDSRKGEPDPRPGPRGHPGGSRWLTLTEIDIEPPG